MPKMKWIKWVALWVVVQSLGFAQSEGPCAVALEKLNRLVQSNSFEVRREFANYTELFPQSFLNNISKLGADGHWVDAGSGEGFAVEDFQSGTVLHFESFVKNAESSFWQRRRILINKQDVEQASRELNRRAPNEKPRITAIAFQMERKPPQIPRVDFKIGRFFEDIPDSEIGQADIISDLYGVMSYSSQVDQVVKKYHKILKPGGRAYIFLGDYVESPYEHTGWYASIPKSEVTLKKNQKTSLLDWLMSVKGFRATVEHRLVEITGRSVPHLIQRSTLVLEKISDELEIPELRLLGSDEAKPPIRNFEEVMP